MSKVRKLIFLAERISVKGYLQKGNVFYVFSSRGRNPNLILTKNKEDKYSILILKNNDIIYPLNTDFEEILSTAKKNNLIKLSFKDIDASKFLEILVTKEGVPLAALQTMFPDLSNVEQDNTLKVDGFDIIFQNESEAKYIAELLTEVCDILSKHGLKKLCYGKIISTPTLGRKVLADYSKDSDSVRISNQAKKNKENIRVLLHELAHRQYYKNLNDAKRKEIQDSYFEMLKGFKFEPSVGDIFLDNGKEVEIYKTEYKRKLFYFYREVDTLTPSWKATKEYLSNLTPVKMKNKREEHPLNVSSYARSSPLEFFAEVFSFGLLNNDKDLKEFIARFI